MSNYEQRLDKIEAAFGLSDEPSILDNLVEFGASGFTALLETYAEDEIISILCSCMDDEAFSIERLRGIYPDDVLAKAYSKIRNYAFSSEIRQRVRQLARLYQTDGTLKPKYILRENGLINDA